jgi:hypothetical protein
MYQIKLKSPPPMANIIATLDNPDKKDAQTSKVNKSTNPRIPMQAVAVPKTLLRSITTEMTRPATSERRNPKKVPGCGFFPPKASPALPLPK